MCTIPQIGGCIFDINQAISPSLLPLKSGTSLMDYRIICDFKVKEKDDRQFAFLSCFTNPHTLSKLNERLKSFSLFKITHATQTKASFWIHLQRSFWMSLPGNRPHEKESVVFPNNRTKSQASQKRGIAHSNLLKSGKISVEY